MPPGKSRSTSIHAADFLADPDSARLQGLVVLSGSEPYLKRSVLDIVRQAILGDAAEADLGMTRFSGKDAELRAVRDELMTVSMFSARRIVVVEDADDFVTRFRAGLEDYLDRPAKASLLVLTVKTWRSNTKLAKKVAKSGLTLDCSELTGAKLTTWLTRESKARFGKKLQRDAAALLPELVGSGLSQLAQELEKLSTYVGDAPEIGVEDVRSVVGGWRTETTWSMIDAVRDGDAATALAHLDNLLNANEAPQKILGGINFVFRKLAVATELSRQGQPLPAALSAAGVFPRDTKAAEQYLRRVRRPRAERILEKLAATDSGLKGGSSAPERWQLEQLLLWLAGKVPV